MPSFASTQSVSGRSGFPSGPKGGRGSSVRGVAAGGVGPRYVDVALVVGGGSSLPTAQRTGPSGRWSFEFEANSQAQQFRGSFTVAGVTRDSTGAALASCTVTLFETGSDNKLGQTVSDGSGAFTFTLSTNSSACYLLAYLPGAPDRAGATVNTVVPT